MQEHVVTEDKEDLKGLRHVLQLLIASYTIGWGILTLNVGRVPLLNGVFWQAAAVTCFCLTIWLAWKLSIRALVAWASIVLTVVFARSFAYGNEGIFNPLGVWLLVLTGVSITGLSVITVNALTGRLEEMSR